jgi:L-asparaginase II
MDVAWTITDALVFVRSLQRAISSSDYCVGLTGSVLSKGFSDKDLDVIVFPHSTEHQNIEYLYGSLQRFGMKRCADKEKVHAIWRKKGSSDTKHVEVWEYEGKRIDLFFMQ